MTPDANEQYELRLEDNGSFKWLISRPDSDGASHHAFGRWKQTGDLIAFEIDLRSSDTAPVPTVGTVRGDRLDLEGFGTFA